MSIEDVEKKMVLSDTFSPPDGWLDLIVELDGLLVKLDPDYEILQIKSKFGGLRFYASFKPEVSDQCFALVEEYENKSFKICEICGRPGMQRKGSWIETLCDRCASDAAVDLRAL